MHAYPNLRHIRLLVHALTQNSLSRAADMVGISQPAASQAISRLEEQFGGQLFERRANGIFVTDRGRVVAARAERVLQLLRHASAALARRAKPNRAGGPDLLEARVTIAQLRALAAFGQTSGFPAAARRLHQAEPSVQRAAREVERVAGVPLFEGRQQAVRLTSAGRSLAGAASLALKELESAVQEVGELDGRFDGRVVIGTLPLVRTSIVPRAIAMWSARRPTASIEIVDGPYDLLIHGLGIGDMDLVVGALRESPQPRGFVQEKLFDDGLAIVARAGHPLFSSTRVARRDLGGYQWVLPRKGTPTRAIFDCFAAEAGIESARTGLIETGSLVSIRGILMETDRLTVLSPRQIVHEREAGLLDIVPIELPRTDRPIGVTTRHGWKPTTLQREFLAALRAAVAD
jgi:LysR family transcriptional regulator, regulator for genes of the gallate degradation pathway